MTEPEDRSEPDVLVEWEEDDGAEYRVIFEGDKATAQYCSPYRGWRYALVADEALTPLARALVEARAERDKLLQSGAAQWEADHQRACLERYSLADEFPFGCDAIDAVASKLVAARAERDALRVIAAEYALLLERTASACKMRAIAASDEARNCRMDATDTTARAQQVRAALGEEGYSEPKEEEV